MPAFTALVHTDPAGGFDVSFPDLPGLNARADTRNAAPDVALLALLERLKQMNAAHEPIPIPSERLGISGHPDEAGGEAILVEA